jgi:acetate CoA/acetoacetate CoA-transferase alpha subunit
MKTVALKDAVALIPDGASLMIGGFMGVGTPERLVDELVRQGKRNLTVIANDNAIPGVGTVVEQGKQRIEVDGRPYLLETALRADFALVRAFMADYIGNLYYALTARNFNPVIAMAADTVIVEADHIVPVGVIAPDNVVTPAPVVDYIVSHA